MRNYGLIGFPLSHSFSPEYFAEKFRKEGIKDASYRLFSLHEITELPELLQRESNLLGLNVTIPYKETVLPFLDELSEEAESIAAVNTIKILRSNSDLVLTGYNTDIFGFRQSIKPFLASQHHNALVLGSGGASKAVKFVLEQIGIETIVVSRTGNVNYSRITPETIAACKLIVNCTPMGTFPETNLSPPLPPFFYDQLTPEHLLYDLIYNPAETLFLKKGKEKGAQTLNGSSMLHQQAEESWRIWNQR